MLAVDKRRPTKAFCNHNGYNRLPGRQVGCWAVDYVVGWGTERLDASPTPPPFGDHALGVCHGRWLASDARNVRVGKLVERKEL